MYLYIYSALISNKKAKIQIKNIQELGYYEDSFYEDPLKTASLTVCW